MSQISPQKLRGLKGVKDQLTNITTSKDNKCAECSSKLGGSVWLNRVVFYSISQEYDSGYLCVRCCVEPTKYLKTPITEQQLTDFVKKTIEESPDYDPSPLKRKKNQRLQEELESKNKKYPKYLSHHCKSEFQSQHKLCKNFQKQCTCFCHTSNPQPKKRVFILSNKNLKNHRNTFLESCKKCNELFKAGDEITSITTFSAVRYHTSCFEEGV